jgi:hypothetical protein
MLTSTYRNKNILIEVPKLGIVLFSPRHVEQTEFDRVSLVICPQKITDSQEMTALSEWAALTQTPLFCLESDKLILENEGFGAYRFQTLAPYRRVHLYGGVIEFIPVQRKKNYIFFNKNLDPLSYHILMRPFGAQAILYLSEPKMSFEDLQVCKGLKPKCYALKVDQNDLIWEEIEKNLETTIEYPKFELGTKKKKKAWKPETLEQHTPATSVEVQRDMKAENPLTENEGFLDQEK